MTCLSSFAIPLGQRREPTAGVIVAESCALCLACFASLALPVKLGHLELGVAALALSLPAAAMILLSRPVHLIAFLIAWYALHYPLTGMLAQPEADAMAVKVIMASKGYVPLALLSLALAVSVARRTWRFDHFWLGLACMAVITALALRAGASMAALAYAQSFMAQFMFLLLAMLLPWRREHLSRLCGVLVIFLGIELCVVALEMAGLQRWLWRDLWHIDETWPEKGTLSGLSNGVPSVWGTNVLGRRYHRPVGTFGNPIPLGFFLAAACLALWQLRAHQPGPRWRLNLPLGAGLALLVATFSKSGLMLFALGILAARALRWQLVSRWITLTALLAAFAGAFVLGLRLRTTVKVRLTATVHGLESLARAPLGHGVGSAGIMARTFDSPVQAQSPEASWLRAHPVSESGLGVIAYQLGVPGLVAFVVFFFSLGWRLARSYQRLSGVPNGAGVRAWVIIGAALAVCQVFIVNEAALNPYNCFLPMLFVGLACHLADEHDVNRLACGSGKRTENQAREFPDA